MCVVSVVSQALLQAHDPGIQAKLLAMQRQMQLSGVTVPTDSPATPASSGKYTMTHHLPTFASAARHGRVLTAEQKEDQTRQVVDCRAAVPQMRRLFVGIFIYIEFLTCQIDTKMIDVHEKVAR